jgi:hypothetical protein
LDLVWVAKGWFGRAGWDGVDVLTM